MSMGPEDASMKLWTSETARLWPVERDTFLASWKNLAPSSEKWTPYLLSCFPAVNRAFYKVLPLGFWHHRSLHRSGQRPGGLWLILTILYDIVKRREISGPGSQIYPSVQIIFVLSEGEHLHLETFEVGGILNPAVHPNGMEDHLVGVHWVCTPSVENVSSLKCFHVGEKIFP